MTPSTIPFDFGDIVLVPFPFTDQSASKKRAAVIVSSAAYQRVRADLIVMPVTSQIRPVSDFGQVIVAQWKEAGLLLPSAIKPVLATIERRLVLRNLGRLMDPDRRSLHEILRVILG